MKKGQAEKRKIGDLEKPMLVRKVKRLDKQNRRLKERLRQVEEENRALKSQLEEYRKKFFKKNKVKPEDEQKCSRPKKRGAPIGHPGSTRRKPEHLEKLPRDFSIKKADLIGQLRRMLKRQLGHPRADKFLRRLHKHIEELVTCLDFAEVCAHNNWAERLLRGSVIMRKITFGNRSDNGVQNHQVLMSLLQTARLRQLNPLTFFHQLLTDPATASAAIFPNTALSR